MRNKIFVRTLILALLLTTLAVSFSPVSLGKNTIADDTYSLDISKITMSWNLSILYQNKDAATAELGRMRSETSEMNRTYRPLFINLTGALLLDYIQREENFSKSLDILSAYATAQNS
jgi:hypothetical protein